MLAVTGLRCRQRVHLGGETDSGSSGKCSYLLSLRPLVADSRLHAQLIAGLARSGMVGVECDPNWSNLKSLRITPVARLSQRRQSDAAAAGAVCVNERPYTHSTQQRIEHLTRLSIYCPVCVSIL